MCLLNLAEKQKQTLCSMKFHRIWATALHYIYTQKRSIPRTMDIFYWPILNVLLWGFLSMYLVRQGEGIPNILGFLLGGLILWQLFSRAQQDISIHFLEDIWNRNLINLFVSPLTNTEYILSFVLMSVVKVILTGIVMGLITLLFYQFNIFSFVWQLLPFIVNLFCFGWIVGLFIMAMIIRWGTDAQILAFSFAFLLQPFSAVFYPVSILPPAAQTISYLLPSTYIFEGMRTILAGGMFPGNMMTMSIVLNVVYLILSILLFKFMFKKVLEKGLLTKLE